MDRPLAIPRYLGISFWWILLIFIALQVLTFRMLAALPATEFLFGWMVVQASWLKKAAPASEAAYWCLASCISYPIMHAVYAGLAWMGSWTFLILLVAFAVGLKAAFTLRAELEYHFTEVDPVGLKLDSLTTFWWTVFYFQYHLHRIYPLQQRRDTDPTHAAV